MIIIAEKKKEKNRKDLKIKKVFLPNSETLSPTG